MMQSFHEEFWENPDPPTLATPYEATLRRHASVPSSTFANVTYAPTGQNVWDLRVGRFLFDEEDDPTTGNRTTPNRFDATTGISSGNVREMGGLKLDRITAKAVFNRYQSGWPGANHELRAGIQLERGEHRGTNVIPGGVRYVDNNNAPAQAIYREPSISGGRADMVALFASDSIATTFRFSGWHDDRFHYLPALSVMAPSTGRPVLVQRVDFTTDDPGSRRLLKGVRYAAGQRVPPGGTVELVSNTGAADPAEIASPLALGSISAIVCLTDEDGQTGIVSAVARAPELPDRASLASLPIRQFTVNRRQHNGRFIYTPRLTLAETSGRSRASVRKIVFELLDVGAPGQAPPLWSGPEVPAGDTISLVTGKNGWAPWFEIDSTGDASRVSVAISFVDAAGHGGLVSAIAAVQR